MSSRSWTERITDNSMWLVRYNVFQIIGSRAIEEGLEGSFKTIEREILEDLWGGRWEIPIGGGRGQGRDTPQTQTTLGSTLQVLWHC